MKRQTQRLVLEPLEDRTLLSTCTVTDLGDGGRRGQLRHCITKVNALPGPDLIDFAVTGTISLTGALPTLASDIDIQGPGADKLTVRRTTGGNYRIFGVAFGTTVKLYGLTISNGSVVGVGGGGIANGGSLIIDSCAVSGNSAQSHPAPVEGGGIYSSGALEVRNSVISGNVASGMGNPTGPSGNARGGGIIAFGSLLVENSTIANNSANASFGPNPMARGGGIYFATPGGTLRNTTIAGNVLAGATKEGAGVYVAFGSVTASNTIISLNTPSNVFGTIGGGFNLIDVDPKLGPLQNNGGPTQTMALLPGSPAIDAGDNTGAPARDQRGAGYPRIANGTIDIGAYEVQSTPAPIPPRSRTLFGNAVHETRFRAFITATNESLSHKLETEFLGSAFQNGVRERDALAAAPLSETGSQTHRPARVSVPLPASSPIGVSTFAPIDNLALADSDLNIV